jgi:hypothetical protein
MNQLIVPATLIKPVQHGEYAALRRLTNTDDCDSSIARGHIRSLFSAVIRLIMPAVTRGAVSGESCGDVHRTMW